MSSLRNDFLLPLKAIENTFITFSFMSENLHLRPLRYELKFIVDIQAGFSFLASIKDHTIADEHCLNNIPTSCINPIEATNQANTYNSLPEPTTLSGDFLGYEVSSLYYDTADLRFHFDRQESSGYRRKVRLRAYIDGSTNSLSNPSCTGLFLEIKEKHKHRVGKKRCKLVDISILDKIKNHSEISIKDLSPYVPTNHVATREVIYLNNILKLSPVVIVRYIRSTLIGKYDSNLRITLDHRISTGATSLLKHDPDRENLILPAHLAVLEIKCFGSLPLWLQSSLLRFGFSRTRMSKYCAGVELNRDYNNLYDSEITQTSDVYETNSSESSSKLELPNLVGNL